MRTRILLSLAAVAALGATMTRCSCSGLGFGDGGQVDTVIVGADTVLVPREVKALPALPADSAAKLDTATRRDTIPVRRGKIVSPAGAFPKVDTSAIVVDSVGRRIISDRLCVVIMKQGAGSGILDRWERQFKQAYPDSAFRVTYKEPFALVMQIAVPAERRDSVREELPDKIKGIPFAVIDEELQESNDAKRYTPNDPIFNNPIFNEIGYDWYFDHIQAREAWGVTRGSRDVVVAIVDDYFDLDHPELNSERIVQPYSVVSGMRDVAPPSDDYGHGTHVASLAIGQMDNYAGACGIAPGCSFMPISVGGDDVSSSCVLVALLRAIHSGADVVNISMGWGGNMSEKGMSIREQIRWSRRHMRKFEDLWNYIYDVANSRNVTIVYAAGNERDYIGVDPKKRSDGIICVSSTDMDDHWSCQFSNVGNFSEYGTHASTLSAPGEFMFGALPGGDWQIDLTPSRGTSYSAPLVTGAVALIKSIDNSLTTKEIIDILQRTGKPVEGPGGRSIGNRIQIHDALTEAKKAVTCFDDFVRNPIGLWGATSQKKLQRVSDGTYSGQGRSYYEIKSLKNGRICGRQIMNEITEDKVIVNRIMYDPMYLETDRRHVWKDTAKVSKLSASELEEGVAMTAYSRNEKGLLVENPDSYWGMLFGGGFYGGVTVEFCRGEGGKLLVKTIDTFNGESVQELKRFKRIKKEYKAE